MVHDLIHNPGLGDSDHESLTFIVNCYKEIYSKSSPPNYFKGDYTTMKNRLQKIDWPSKLRGKFLVAYKNFMVMMDKVTEGCIPLKVNMRKKKNIYMTHDALKHKDRKGRLWRRYKKSNTHYDRMRYLKVKNKLRSFTRHLRLEF